MPKFNWFHKFTKGEEPQSHYFLADFYHNDELHETVLFFSDVLWENHKDNIVAWKQMISSPEVTKQLRPKILISEFVVMKIILNVKDPDGFPIYLLCYSQEQETGWFEDKIFAYTREEIFDDPTLHFVADIID